MSIIFKTSILFLVLTFGIISFSCHKDAMIPPTIDFTTGPGYTFVVTRSYDGGAEETIDNVAIPAAEAGEFTKDYDLTTRSISGAEKYTFTVTNRDGLITTRAIIITTP
jgi:hypothetical protein